MPTQNSETVPVTAVYYRVSTAAQSCENQKPDVERLLASRGLQANLVYEEQASAVKHRPEFQRLLADAQAGKFGTLVLWALDRFGRSMHGNIGDLLALDKAGVRVVSVREPWLDTAGPVRELLVAIFSWVSQQERARLIERTRAGIAVARAKRGGKWGQYSKAPLLAADRAKDAEAVAHAWADAGKPDGFRGLASRLGGCGHTTAHKRWTEVWSKTYRQASPEPVAEEQGLEV